MLIIVKGFCEFRAGLEGGGLKDFTDPAVEPFGHAVCLRVPGLDKPMFYIVIFANNIKNRLAGWLPFTGCTEAAGKSFAVIGQDFFYFGRESGDQPF